MAGKYRRRPFDLFEVAQRVYGPSYISFEFALSYHGWITREAALAALSRTGFLARRPFRAGHTSGSFTVRIGSPKILIFLLNVPDRSFRLEKYLSGLSKELEAYGCRVETADRQKETTAVQKAFFKDDSPGKILHLRHIRADRSMSEIRIRLEVDTNPPAGGNVEEKYLMFPFAAEVVCQDGSSLFAGKLHALLCREDVKGRDWYDLLFYVGRKTIPNKLFFRPVSVRAVFGPDRASQSVKHGVTPGFWNVFRRWIGPGRSRMSAALSVRRRTLRWISGVRICFLLVSNGFSNGSLLFL